MNIFVLHENARCAARQHVDKHVIKQILETAQLLSTAIKINKPEVHGLYGITHQNHPCSKWTRESAENFYWLVGLGMALCDEYLFRYKKVHKSEAVMKEAARYGNILPSIARTPFAQAMPDEYKVPNDPVKAYRNYYRGAKTNILVYTSRQPPRWITDLARVK